MTTHASILAWEIHGQRSLAGSSLWGCRVKKMWKKENPPTLLVGMETDRVFMGNIMLIP